MGFDHVRGGEVKVLQGRQDCMRGSLPLTAGMEGPARCSYYLAQQRNRPLETPPEKIDALREEAG